MQLGKLHEQLLQQDPSMSGGGGTRNIELMCPEKLEDIEEMESVVGGTGSVISESESTGKPEGDVVGNVHFGAIKQYLS